MYLQVHQTELTHEALSLYTIEVLLPPILHAASALRQHLTEKILSVYQHLPPAVAAVIQDEGLKEEALGGPPLVEGGPSESILKHLSWAIKQRKDETDTLLKWQTETQSADDKQKEKTTTENYHSMSLVGALRGFCEGAPRSSNNIPPVTDIKTEEGLEEGERLAVRLLLSVRNLLSFISTQKLLPSVPLNKKIADKQAEGKGRSPLLLPFVGGPHQVTLLAYLKGLPPAKPVEAFVRAFSR